jgi:multidrug efflux pump subunit AcrA (membrane-fusion protein)
MGGMFVRVRVPLEKREALLVPDVALQFDQGGRYVFTVDEQQVVQQKRVKIGERVDRMRVIEEGLKITDNVIVDGIQRARPGAKVNPLKPTVARNPQAEAQPASKKD